MLSQADFARASRTLQNNPAQTIRNAREGSLVEIKIIANCIQSMRELQTPEVVEMFCSHLDISKTPDHRISAPPKSPAAYAAERAISSLLGLGNFGPLLSPYNRALLAPISRTWPGIFKWMVFFDKVNRQPGMGDRQTLQNTQQIVAYALYSITQDDDIQNVITNTPGIIPLATSLWKEESPGGPGSLLPIPVGSAAFHHVLFSATDAILDEVVKYGGAGKARNVADLAISRLLAAIRKPSTSAPTLHAYVDILVSMSRGSKHPLRRAILRQGGIATVTKALLKVSAMNMYDDDVRDTAIACFGFISNLIEAGSGLPYVRQAIQEGLLQGFVAISPAFRRFDPEARGFALELIESVIPRYLVYRSVIVAVHAATQTLESADSLTKIERSPVKDAWKSMEHLARERALIKYRSDIIKKEQGYCDNCHKAGPRDSLKKCSGCQVTYYCSKECQVAGWKKIHKGECVLKDQERLALKNEVINKDDRFFHHHLTIRESLRNRPRLRAMAAGKFPDLPLSEIGVSVDYTKVPHTFDVFVLKNHDISKDIRPSETRTQEARSEGIIEKARMSEGRHTLIESMVSLGESTTMVMTLTASSLWEGEDNEMGGLMDGGDQQWLGDEPSTNMDEVDWMMAQAELSEEEEGE
ncbi:hypothetical protein BV25DRAFT_1914117 [Artomyces pyxidatus]|uniref:Uncharacterized protein n=1 Tax=Artomyces pyxidatus TaxID=48021 RepID=A0ACB8T850_9AGAM|nr:hypothetical protein BV25DRAFT_1914117 [Artomyces pyxidatus]